MDLHFVPFDEKAGNVNLLLLRSRTHQMFGHFSGTLRHGDRRLTINHVPGWAEEHLARW